MSNKSDGVMIDPQPVSKPAEDQADMCDKADEEDIAIPIELPLEENDLNAQPE